MKNNQEPDEHILLLFIKEQDGSMDDQEAVTLTNWKNERSENSQMYRDLVSLYKKSGTLPYLTRIDQENDWKKVKSRLGSDKSLSRKIYWSVAASIAGVLLVGYLLRSVIDKQIHFQSYPISDRNEFIYLPDSTRITIKSGTMLYVSDDYQNDRKIILEGEAFFEVKKDPTSPFIVHSGKTSTTVLGTAFNLKTIDQISQLTVVEGSVNFESGSSSIMVTGGLAAIGKKGQVELVDFNSNRLAWRTHFLKYNQSTLEEVLADLKDVYGVEFVLSQKSKALKVTSEFDNETLPSILEELQIILPIDISREGDLYTVAPK